jgi:hypothetical protein
MSFPGLTKQFHPNISQPPLFNCCRRRRFRPSMLIILCLATVATAQASHSLFERASPCLDSSYNQCLQAGLSSSFCCPPTSVCHPLASNTTVLCCLEGEDCSTIRVITCDISAQNKTLHPDNTLMTTALDVPLPICDGNCCPFGYTCTSIGNCVENADQNVDPSSVY